MKILTRIICCLLLFLFMCGAAKAESLQQVLREGDEVQLPSLPDATQDTPAPTQAASASPKPSPTAKAPQTTETQSHITTPSQGQTAKPAESGISATDTVTEDTLTGTDAAQSSNTAPAPEDPQNDPADSSEITQASGKTEEQNQPNDRKSGQDDHLRILFAVVAFLIVAAFALIDVFVLRKKRKT